MSKRDKPGSGRPDDNQGHTPPTFGAGTGASPQYPRAGRPPGTPPPWAPPANIHTPPGGDSQTGIGWYGSQQPSGYYPASGPLAASAGPGKDDLAWGNPGRKRLKNILLFGAAPVVLAGVVAAAYLITTSGKAHPAANAGFHVTTASTGGAPQVQNVDTPVPSTTSASPSPSPSASLSFPALPASTTATGKPKSTGTASAPKPKPTPRQSHSSGTAPSSSASPSPSQAPAVATPSDLGAPDFNTYCASLNEGTGVTVASNAYGWRCSADESVSLSTQAVCAYTFSLPEGDAIDVTTDYGSVGGIQCWSTHGELGGLDFSAYCSAGGYGSAVLTGSYATGWSCTGESGIDENTACEVQYNNIGAFARYASYTDANSWQCWG